ncbi:hypothetical protein PVAND_005471 [Polypedilum vanderplanki]|uniref:Uncharacterized protein n=1 Tax=Polypedilum vanderplanki TaxID=319348 RepID=A0A9J6C026_POLVA|nr:hypothetical protein PVAND_005471 [Polypedilum vanderplanki]
MIKISFICFVVIIFVTNAENASKQNGQLKEILIKKTTSFSFVPTTKIAKPPKFSKLPILNWTKQKWKPTIAPLLLGTGLPNSGSLASAGASSGSING